MKVALVLTRWWSNPYGGWFSYTQHLARGLRAAGAEVHILGLVDRKKPADLGAGVQVAFIPPGPDAVRILNKYDVVHVVFLASEKTEGEPPAYKTLRGVERGLVVTMHDPAEVRKGTSYEIGLLNAKRPAVVTIRAAPTAFFREKLPGASITLVPHPFVFQGASAAPREDLLVSTCRVDFDKNTHLLLQAKPKRARFEIWTGGVNRIYAFHKLRPLGWAPSWYRGAFGREDAVVHRVYARAKGLVDLSTIAKDGGGTQYTFLEAIDAGCALLLHSGWATGASDALQPGVHYLSAGTPEEVAAKADEMVLNEDLRKSLVNNALEAVAHHDAKRVAETYLSIYRAL